MRIRYDLRTAGLVIGIAKANGGTGLGLYLDAMARRHQGMHAGRRDADAELVVFDFLGDADQHGA